MTGKKTIGEQIADLPSQCKAATSYLQRHEIEVGGTYTYGDHKVTVLHTYYNKYTRQAVAIIDDPKWKDVKPVPVSDLHVLVPDVAKFFIDGYHRTTPKTATYELFQYMMRSVMNLSEFFRQTYPELTRQQRVAAVEYVMERYNHKKLSTPPKNKEK